MAQEPIRACDVRFLPIVASYARKLGVMEEVDRLCGRKRGLSPGRVVLALVLDALSGRSPLFRLPDAFAKLDTELLLGEAIAPSALNDDAVGRVLDRIYEVGTGKVLSAVALRAVKLFNLNTTHVHHDTTSRTVYGDYDLYGEESRDQPFLITFGFSKDHRPDLKQLIQSLLCVDEGIPIYSRCQNGNESDKVVNRNLIPQTVERMREFGQDNFLYVADSLILNRDRAQHSWELSFTNEFLNCQEEFRGIQIFTTNRMTDLDSASLRRFTYKLEFGYLEPSAAVTLYKQILSPLVGTDLEDRLEAELKSLACLTPGDFKVVKTKSRFKKPGEVSHELLIAALREEVKVKEVHAGKKAVGF